MSAVRWAMAREVLSFVLAFAALLCALHLCTGCKQGLAATELLARKVQCALAHRDLSNEQLLLECAVDPKDARNIIDIVGQEREHDARMMRVGCSTADAGF